MAGVSIGLVTSKDLNNIYPLKNSSVTLELAGAGPKYAILTDITGTEDHYGDMDFKIAGTKKGITAMQLDVKLSDGVPSVLLEEALDHARIGIL